MLILAIYQSTDKFLAALLERLGPLMSFDEDKCDLRLVSELLCIMAKIGDHAIVYAFLLIFLNSKLPELISQEE